MNKKQKRNRNIRVRMFRALELQKRIEALLPDHPEILKMGRRPHDLFNVPGFSLDDLEDSVREKDIVFALEQVIERQNEKCKSD